MEFGKRAFCFYLSRNLHSRPLVMEPARLSLSAFDGILERKICDIIRSLKLRELLSLPTHLGGGWLHKKDRLHNE